MNTPTKQTPYAKLWADKHGLAIDEMWDGKWHFAILRNCTMAGAGLAYAIGRTSDLAMELLWDVIVDEEIRYVRDGAIYTYTVNPEDL